MIIIEINYAPSMFIVILSKIDFIKLGLLNIKKILSKYSEILTKKFIQIM